MKIIGLTGGIGTGKSTVSSYLAAKGIEIIDADKIAHEIVEPGQPALLRIAETFGQSIITDDGSLNRKALAGIVFNNAEKKEALESITMPTIKEIVTKRAEHARNSAAGKGYSMAVIDAPLLFESGLDAICDAIWVVDAELETRISRAMQRDGASRESIEARIRNQISMDESLSQADVVLDNSGTLENLYKAIDKNLEKYV